MSRVDVIIAVISFVPICLCPETFAPVLLLKKAKRLRSQGEDDVIAPVELEDRSLKAAIKTNTSRPFRMFFRETIVLAIGLYLSMIYGTFYLFFQSYNLIFQGKFKSSGSLLGILLNTL